MVVSLDDDSLGRHDEKSDSKTQRKNDLRVELGVVVFGDVIAARAGCEVVDAIGRLDFTRKAYRAEIF